MNTLAIKAATLRQERELIKLLWRKQHTINTNDVAVPPQQPLHKPAKN